MFVTQVDIEMNREILEFLSSYRHLINRFSKRGGPQADVNMKVVEGLKNFGAMKKKLKVRNVSLRVKKGFHERVILPAVTKSAEMWDTRLNKRHRLDVIVFNYLRRRCRGST